jgi:hypothetical protein
MAIMPRGIYKRKNGKPNGKKRGPKSRAERAAIIGEARVRAAEVLTSQNTPVIEDAVTAAHTAISLANVRQAESLLQGALFLRTEADRLEAASRLLATI